MKKKTLYFLAGSFCQKTLLFLQTMAGNTEYFYMLFLQNKGKNRETKFMAMFCNQFVGHMPNKR